MALRFGRSVILGTATLGLFIVLAQDTSQQPTLAEQAGPKSLEHRIAAWEENQPSELRPVDDETLAGYIYCWRDILEYWKATAPQEDD
jgi:hypothetical protein